MPKFSAAFENNGAIEQLNGCEGETATLLFSLSVTFYVDAGGFAPRQFNRYAVSGEMKVSIIQRKEMMKLLLLMLVFTAVAISFVACQSSNQNDVLAQTSNEESQVRQTVQSFYDDFNAHNFGRVENYTTEDWNHINPGGGWTRGREAVLKELKEVHSTFLKGVSSKIEDMSVRFATPDVAIVTVTNQMGTYALPDGIKRENERQIKTFVVVKRNGKWQIIHDQNTVIVR